MLTRRPVPLLCLFCALVSIAGAASARGEVTAGRRGLIVYWSESPWPSIWMIRPDGSRRHRILRNRQNAKRPRLSPDRKWVAFDGTPKPKPVLSDFDIQLVRLDGSGLRTLTKSSKWDVDAQWSPDGKVLSFSRSPPHPIDASESVIWLVRRDGSGLRRLVSGFGARWSPQGTQLVYQAQTPGSQGDLFVINADGSDSRPLLSTPELEHPAGWSPDGSKILFTRLGSGGGSSQDVFVMNADGTQARKLAHGFAGSWSPDGSKILYTRSFSSPLFVMDADGSHKHKVASVAASEPNWR